MPDLATVSSAVDFVEDNLCHAISVGDMADAVGYSVYHFCRMFNRATHHTPYDYLMRRRLSEAARVLRSTDRRILDIALEYQFNSHETFSRAFKRMFDTSPSQLRKQGPADWWRTLPRLTLAHLQQIERGTGLRPTVIDKGAFQVAGLMTLVRGDRTVIGQLWTLLVQDLERCGWCLEDARYLGIVHHPQELEDATFLYMAAIEGADLDGLGLALVSRRVPPLRYARFIHQGPLADLALSTDYVYHTWLPASGERLAQPFALEEYGKKVESANHDERQIAIYVPIR